MLHVKYLIHIYMRQYCLQALALAKDGYVLTGFMGIRLLIDSQLLNVDA